MKPGPKPSVCDWASKKAYGCWLGAPQQTLACESANAPSRLTYMAALDRFRKLVSLLKPQ